MRLLGVERVEQLGPQHVSHLLTCKNYASNSIFQVNTRLAEQQIYDGPAGLESLQRNFRPKL